MYVHISGLDVPDPVAQLDAQVLSLPTTFV